MNFFKIFALCLLVSMAATACANVATNAPLSTSIATNTPSPTSLPPTATVQPPSTVDPRFGPAPKPDAGYALGQYTHQELDGTTTYFWSETDADGHFLFWNPEIGNGEWMRLINANNDGIPLLALPQQIHDAGVADQIWLYVNISDMVSGYDQVQLITRLLQHFDN